jgi:hypothetical protein
LNVNLQDAIFLKEYFEYVEGFSTINWPQIPATANFSPTVVVKPTVVGLFNITHATISYLPNEKTTKIQVITKFYFYFQLNLKFLIFNLKQVGY